MTFVVAFWSGDVEPDRFFVCELFGDFDVAVASEVVSAGGSAGGEAEPPLLLGMLADAE